MHTPLYPSFSSYILIGNGKQKECKKNGPRTKFCLLLTGFLRSLLSLSWECLLPSKESNPKNLCLNLKGSIYYWSIGRGKSIRLGENDLSRFNWCLMNGALAQLSGAQVSKLIFMNRLINKWIGQELWATLPGTWIVSVREMKTGTQNFIGPKLCKLGAGFIKRLVKSKDKLHLLGRRNNAWRDC